MVDKIRVQRAVKELLEAIGEDISRPGLEKTPERVANMYSEIFCGYDGNALENIRVFEEQIVEDQIIVVRDIPIFSMCEHHMLPFTGVGHIAYIPEGGRIIGLSKLGRIANCYARRLQVQERLTAQISQAIYEGAKVKGVGVVVETEHLCVTMRGIKSVGSRTRTCAFNGILKIDKAARKEALEILMNGERF